MPIKKRRWWIFLAAITATVIVVILWIRPWRPVFPVALIRVVDAAGRPISDAVIVPEGMRTKQGPYVSGWYGWKRSANPVPNPPVKTETGMRGRCVTITNEQAREACENDQNLINSFMRCREVDGKTILEIDTIKWPHPHEPLDRWHRFRTWNHPPSQTDLAAETLKLESALSDLVNRAYGPTLEKIALMWKTAPPRMPIPRSP